MVDLPPSTHAPTDVHRVTEEVLGRPEFATARPSWWERVLNDVSEYLGRVLELIARGDRGSIIGTIVLVAVVAGVVYALVLFTRTVRREHPTVPDEGEQLGRTSAQWLTDATAHEAAGRWRDAVRCRYRAVLAEYAAAGLVEEVAGRTSGEYRALVAEAVPAAQEPFGNVTDAFERAWYGHDEPSAAAVAAFTKTAERAAAAARGRRRPLVGAAS